MVSKSLPLVVAAVVAFGLFNCRGETSAPGGPIADAGGRRDLVIDRGDSSNPPYCTRSSSSGSVRPELLREVCSPCAADGGYCPCPEGQSCVQLGGVDPKLTGFWCIVGFPCDVVICPSDRWCDQNENGPHCAGSHPCP